MRTANESREEGETGSKRKGDNKRKGVKKRDTIVLIRHHVARAHIDSGVRCLMEIYF